MAVTCRTYKTHFGAGVFKSPGWAGRLWTLQALTRAIRHTVSCLQTRSRTGVFRCRSLRLDRDSVEGPAFHLAPIPLFTACWFFPPFIQWGTSLEWIRLSDSLNPQCSSWGPNPGGVCGTSGDFYECKEAPKIHPLQTPPKQSNSHIWMRSLTNWIN